MEIRLVKASLIVLVFFLIAACSSDECNITVDQLRLADTVEYNGKEYYLYTRTVGFQEKTVFFELYDTKPIFDQCNKQSNIEYLYTIHFDSFSDQPQKKYIKELTLQLDQPEKLNIVYTIDKNQGVENVYDVKFTR